MQLDVIKCISFE